MLVFKNYTNDKMNNLCTQYKAVCILEKRATGVHFHGSCTDTDSIPLQKNVEANNALWTQTVGSNGIDNGKNQTTITTSVHYC